MFCGKRKQETLMPMRKMRLSAKGTGQRGKSSHIDMANTPTSAQRAVLSAAGESLR
jgi:hypothetical protein